MTLGGVKDWRADETDLFLGGEWVGARDALKEYRPTCQGGSHQSSQERGDAISAALTPG